MHRLSKPALFVFSFSAIVGVAEPERQPARVTVASDGSGNFQTIQAAINAAPADGSMIGIKPGTYRERIAIDKPYIGLRGLGSDPTQVVLTYDLSAGTAGGTGKSASTTVNRDHFDAENLTFENTFSRNRPLTHQESQAVALRVNADRAVFRRVRFLGYQDTLHASGRGCDSEQDPCGHSSQSFATTRGPMYVFMKTTLVRSLWSAQINFASAGRSGDAAVIEDIAALLAFIAFTLRKDSTRRH